MMQRTKCRIQYIGETKRRLSDRFGEHRRAVEKAITQRDINQPTAVSDHFTLPGHSLNKAPLLKIFEASYADLNTIISDFKKY